jgi:hypothetical protein
MLLKHCLLLRLLQMRSRLRCNRDNVDLALHRWLGIGVEKRGVRCRCFGSSAGSRSHKRRRLLQLLRLLRLLKLLQRLRLHSHSTHDGLVNRLKGNHLLQRNS